MAVLPRRRRAKSPEAITCAFFVLRSVNAYMGTGIARFAVDAATGLLRPIGHAPNEALPSAGSGGADPIRRRHRFGSFDLLSNRQRDRCADADGKRCGGPTFRGSTSNTLDVR